MAVTVKVADPPGVMVAGLAEIVTVGAATALTVTVAVVEVVPPEPVAVAV